MSLPGSASVGTAGRDAHSIFASRASRSISPAFREAESVVFGWNELIADAWSIYNGLAEEYKDSFFQTILHPVRAVGTVVILNISAGQNNLRAVQARMSTNSKAAEVLELFGEDHKLTVVSPLLPFFYRISCPAEVFLRPRCRSTIP